QSTICNLRSTILHSQCGSSCQISEKNFRFQIGDFRLNHSARPFAMICGGVHHAVVIFGDQLFTNSPRRSSALGNSAPAAANPRRKGEGTSKQSPGASRIPRSAAAWQKGRASSPLTSHGNAVIPPCG